MNKVINTNILTEELLDEASRRDLLSSGRRSKPYVDQSKGKNRFERRLKSRVSNSTREFNEIDMNKLFKDNILNVVIKVTGETDTYIVKISFGGFLAHLQEQMKRDGSELNVRILTRALTWAFDADDVMIHCSCPDWKYRFAYWANYGSISSDPDEDSRMNGGGSNYEPKFTRTNSDMEMGFACKHVLAVLSNNTWLMKVAAVIFNYINYMKQHRERLYADYIYPAIYDKEYEDDVQLDLDLDDSGDDLATDASDIDVSNKWARTKGQFKKGNKQGIRFTKNEKPKQLDLFNDEEDVENIENGEEVPVDNIENK